MPRVLLVNHMYHSDGEDLLRASADVVVAASDAIEVLAPHLAGCEAIIARTPARVTAAVIDAAPRLRVVSTSGFGTDNIDIPAATAAGVLVVNNPGSAESSVAEHTVALILALAKKLTWSDAAVRSLQPWDFRGDFDAIELQGRTLGVVGFGRIGREVARKMHQGFGMHVLAYDPLLDAAAAEPWAESAPTLEELLPRSDVVTIHCALVPGTRHLFDSRTLALMKSSALLVNTARGPIVDGHALASALAAGALAGAGLDVYETEPPAADNPLLSMRNTILTAHTAGLTMESARRLAISAATQVLAVLEGERPANLINPDAWEARRGQGTTSGGQGT